MTTYIRVPSEVPCLLGNGLAFVDEAIFASVKTTTGHRRKRRLWTRPERTYRVSRHLSTTAAQVFDAWFEDVLRAGQRTFIEKVKDERGVRYYEAAWLEPPALEPQATPRGIEWHLEGNLIVIGDPTETPPMTGELVATYGLALEAEGTVIGAAVLTASYGLALEQAIGLEASYGLALEHYAPDSLDIGDGFHLLIGDGFHLLIE